MEKVALFGATGSIGASTLEVLKANPGAFELVAISGHNNISKLAGLAKQWQPRWLILTNDEKYSDLIALLDGYDGEVLCGKQSLEAMASEPNVDVVVAGVSGVVGLASCYRALACGKKLLLANKEPLVAAGELMLEAARKGGGCIVPVDSEHSGVWQCLGCPDLPLVQAPDIHRLIITASGGPFIDWHINDIANATIEQACQHPTWSMGQKISVDSASMMNKGLELIEAYKLFSVPIDALQVVVHRQSVVHAMVEYHDCSILAQMSHTSMQIPLAKALGHPGFLSSHTKHMNFSDLARIDFEELNVDKFPCLVLATDAMKEGGDKPLRLNAANEEAVASFLDGGIRFGQIAHVIESVLDTQDSVALNDLDSIVSLDVEVRTQAKQYIGELI